MESKMPEGTLENRMFKYLDDLRDSGQVNMFGARPFLIERFDLEDEDYAKQILKRWMQTYEQRHPTEGK